MVEEFMHVYHIAKICHEANKAICISMGDESQPKWEDAPEWQKESAIKGVMAIIDGDVTTPEESHISWLAEKKETGWKYGPVKDPEAKEHPCFVSYAELPSEQQVKYGVYYAIVTAYLSMLEPMDSE